MTRRFSKAALADAIDAQIDYQKAVYQKAAGKPYDDSTGTIQIPAGNIKAAMYMGAICALCDLADSMELP